MRFAARHPRLIREKAEEQALLDERIAEAEANPEAGLAWEEVKAEFWPDE